MKRVLKALQRVRHSLFHPGSKPLTEIFHARCHRGIDRGRQESGGFVEALLAEKDFSGGKSRSFWRCDAVIPTDSAVVCGVCSAERQGVRGSGKKENATLVACT
jgi:hypothetical protein